MSSWRTARVHHRDTPLVLAYPEAVIYSCETEGIEQVAYADAQPVRLIQSFLEARERFLERLLGG